MTWCRLSRKSCGLAFAARSRGGCGWGGFGVPCGQQDSRTLQSCAVKAPGLGDRNKALLEDLAILTGATVITPELGIKSESIALQYLGTAKRIRWARTIRRLWGVAGHKKSWRPARMN